MTVALDSVLPSKMEPSSLNWASGASGAIVSLLPVKTPGLEILPAASSATTFSLFPFAKGVSSLIVKFPLASATPVATVLSAASLI